MQAERLRAGIEGAPAFPPRIERCGRLARCSLVAAATIALTVLLPAGAQVAPSKAEIEAYRGLHAAAHRGDAVTIERLGEDRPALEVSECHRQSGRCSAN